MLQALIFAFPGLEFTANLLCISSYTKKPEYTQAATSKEPKHWKSKKSFNWGCPWDCNRFHHKCSKTPPLMTRSQMTVIKTQIMIHVPENPLFLQIQDGTHKFKQSWLQQWVLLHCHRWELKYQIPGRPVRLKVWSISSAKAQMDYHGDSKRWKNVALGSRMHKSLPAKHLPPPNGKT